MSTFLYYIPAHRQITAADQVPDLGDLKLIVRDGSVSGHRTDKGPDGTGGALFAVNSIEGKTARIQYKADHQRWREYKNETGEILYWIGIDDQEPPQSDWLFRKDHVGGLPYETSDGQVWVFPQVLAFPDFRTIRNEDGSLIYEPGKEDVSLSSLPWVQYEMPDGTLDTIRKPGYAALIERAHQMYEISVLNDMKIDMPLIDARRYCRDLLALNYRIGREEFNLLEFINHLDVYRQMISLSLGLKAITEENEAREKNDIPVVT